MIISNIAGIKHIPLDVRGVCAKTFIFAQTLEFCQRSSERIADGKVEGEIATEFRSDHGVSVSSPFHRINRLHPPVEPENEVIQVEADAQSVRGGNLSIEPIEFE